MTSTSSVRQPSTICVKPLRFLRRGLAAPVEQRLGSVHLGLPGVDVALLVGWQAHAA